ncbi:hypothetical protein [Acetonema longum]|uniref:Uncharacterized protein n=1 Tax=Acetonema longum DSM 6540 TaxID=1009370 RepID=F7NKN8_9FIRM|nr:hypothetical protein [Acetonema longum]EGO63342.1 hypothetical protein ALO_13284 [Acetonema longum DSM 6540]
MQCKINRKLLKRGVVSGADPVGRFFYAREIFDFSAMMPMRLPCASSSPANGQNTVDGSCAKAVFVRWLLFMLLCLLRFLDL